MNKQKPVQVLEVFMLKSNLMLKETNLSHLTIVCLIELIQF